MKTIIFAILIVIQPALLAQTSDSTIVIHLKGQAEFIVSDSLGRKTGFDPIIGQDYEEIPFSSHGTGGVGSEDPNYPSIEYSEFVVDRPDGKYTVEVTGVSSGKFELRGFFLRGRGNGREFFLIGAVAEGQKVFYGITYGVDSFGEMSILKLVTPSTFRQDLENCYKLDLLGKKPLYVDLSHRVEKYEEWIQKGDTVKSREELRKLEKKLDEVYDKTKGPSKDPNHFITEDAYRILKEDVLGLRTK